MTLISEPLLKRISPSTTSISMRGMALKHAVLGLSQLTLTLSVDEAAPKPVQDRSREYLAKQGSSYVMEIDQKGVDLSTGAFSSGARNQTGNISGTVLTFKYYLHAGELHLQDDNTLAGTFYYTPGGTSHQFKATAPVR